MNIYDIIATAARDLHDLAYRTDPVTAVELTQIAVRLENELKPSETPSGLGGEQG